MPVVTALPADKKADLAALISGPHAGKSIDDLLVDLNAKTERRFRPLDSSDLNKWAAVNGVRKAIYQAAENYDHLAYEAAAAARFAMENTQEPLDLNDADVSTLFATLVGAGLIGQLARDDLESRAEYFQSPGETIGIQKVRRGHILEALGMEDQ